MRKTIQRVNICLLCWIALIILGFKVGCEYFPESTFELASESRLPKWIAIPPGLTRADISLTMNYYTKPWGNDVGFILQGRKNKILKKVDGRAECTGPLQLKNPPQGFPPGYPSYQAITVNGITEIIEHRKMEPIFYVTDDPAIWKQYRASGCG